MKMSSKLRFFYACRSVNGMLNVTFLSVHILLKVKNERILVYYRKQGFQMTKI